MPTICLGQQMRSWKGKSEGEKNSLNNSHPLFKLLPYPVPGVPELEASTSISTGARRYQVLHVSA